MKFIDPGFKGNNPGHYSTAVVSNGMLYVSGLLSMDPDTREVCTGDIQAHAAQALQNLDRVLKAAGVERSQVVFCRVYTPSNEYWGPINALYAQFFGEHKPGRVVVSTTPLHFGCLVPEGTSPKKITMIEAHGAKVHVIPGSRDHCADVCRARVREEGIYYANHVVNPFFYEGMKAYIYEVYEELGRIPEHVVLPVGNGTLFIGAVKALEHLLESGAIDHFPKIVALQSEYCDPLLKARELGLDAPVSIDVKPTIAEGIAIGKPLRGSELLEMMKKHDITVVAAPEDKILAARAKIARAGLYIEHTTAANFAAWDHYCELYGPSTDVLITLCGAGIKSDH